MEDIAAGSSQRRHDTPGLQYVSLIYTRENCTHDGDTFARTLRASRWSSMATGGQHPPPPPSSITLVLPSFVDGCRMRIRLLPVLLLSVALAASTPSYALSSSEHLPEGGRSADADDEAADAAAPPSVRGTKGGSPNENQPGVASGAVLSSLVVTLSHQSLSRALDRNFGRPQRGHPDVGRRSRGKEAAAPPCLPASTSRRTCFGPRPLQSPPTELAGNGGGGG
jgi:hypothetical protein